MMTAESLSTITSLLPSAQTVCVFFPEKASTDVILSAVTFARGLKALGKNVTISSPGPISDRFTQFAGVSDVSKGLGNKNLDVSFPYDQEQVDKVSYHIDEESQTFHLVVQPRRGAKPLDFSQVSYTLTGAEADLLFTFGLDKLEDLEQLYIGYEQLFEQTSLVSIHTYDTSFGTVKVNIAGSASYAEVIAYLLQELDVTFDAEISTNLLTAIESATQTFRSLSVTAQTFEIAGKLLSMGARRVRIGEDSRSQDHGQERAEDRVELIGEGSQQFGGLTSRGSQDSVPPLPKKQKQKKDEVPSNPGVRLV